MGKSFKQRYKALGDRSENVFKMWAKQHNVQWEDWGLKRPEFRRFPKLPARLRHAPDYICETKTDHFFVEVKGVGRDQTIKIKHEDLRILDETIQFFGMPVQFFIFDAKYQRTGMFDCQLLIDDDKSALEVGAFWDGIEKPYYGIPTEHNWITWELIEEVE